MRVHKGKRLVYGFWVWDENLFLNLKFKQIYVELVKINYLHVW